MARLEVRGRSRDFEVCECTIVVDRCCERCVRSMRMGIGLRKVVVVRATHKFNVGDDEEEEMLQRRELKYELMRMMGEVHETSLEEMFGVFPFFGFFSVFFFGFG